MRAVAWGTPNKVELLKAAALVALAAELTTFASVTRSGNLDEVKSLIRERSNEPTAGAPMALMLRGPRDLDPEAEPTKSTTKRVWIAKFQIAVAVFDTDPAARDTTLGAAISAVVNSLHTFGESLSFSKLGRTLTVEGSTPLTIGRQDVGPYAAETIEAQAIVWE